MQDSREFTEKAFRSFFYEHFTSVCLFVQDLLQDPEAARPVARSAFLAFWNEVHTGAFTFNSYAQAKTRIYRLAADGCIPHLAQRESKDLLQWLYQDNEALWLKVYEKELENLAFTALEDFSRKERSLALLSFSRTDPAQAAARLHCSPSKWAKWQQAVFRKIDKRIKVFAIHRIQQVHLD